MFWRTVFGCLLAATVVMASGCVTMHPMACGVGAVAAGCGIDGCGGCIGHPHMGYHQRPLLGKLNAALTGGSGCGEVYWGEWINHPPKYCDPCDYDGNWVGAGPSGARCWHPFQGLRNLWGYRYASGGYEADLGGYRYASGGYESGCDMGCSPCMSSELHYDPMESPLIPQPAPDGNTQPEPDRPLIPQPEPDQSNDSANGRQALRRPAPGGQVTTATYRQRPR